MTPQQLKNSILQMAMQGKLVEQRPEEGTGEKLYQQIQKEKQKLIKEGKIKKQKALPEITDDEIPFEIPENWKWVRLRDIANLYNGRAYKQSELLSQGKYPVLRVGNLFTNKQWYYSNLELDEEKYCDKGDLLYSWSASFGPHIWNGERVIYHYHIWKIEHSRYVYRNYFYWYLWFDTANLQAHGHGVAMRHITKEGTEKMVVPLPPFCEQKRIASKIEKLLPYLDRYGKAYDRLETYNQKFPDDLRKSILQEAIQGKLVKQRPEEGTGEELYQQIQTEKQGLIKEGKIKKQKALPKITEDEIPFEIPENWKWVRLGDIAIMNPKNNIPDDLPVSFIPMAMVDGGYNNHHTYKIKTWSSTKKGFSHFQNGDIGIAKITPCFQNRKSVIFSNLLNGYGAGTTELSIVRIMPTLCSPEYLLWYFKSEQFIVDGMKSFTGTAGQQRIHKDFLRTYPIPLPPLAEQKRIVAKIEELMPYVDKCHA